MNNHQAKPDYSTSVCSCCFGFRYSESWKVFKLSVSSFSNCYADLFWLSSFQMAAFSKIIRMLAPLMPSFLVT